jgi:hypothetical protein
MQALQGQRARQIHRHCGALSHAEPALESCFSSRRKGLLCRQFRLRRSLATRAHRMARRSNRSGGRNRFYHRCKINRHCGTLGLPAAPTVRSGRGRLPGDFGPRAFCRGSLAPPARGPEGPGRWRCEGAGPGRRAQGAGRRDRGPQATALWQEGRRAAGRGAQARGAGLEALWRAGNRTVARGPQFRDAGPRDNAREPRSSNSPTPRKASQTALRGPRSMVSARGPRR